MKIFDTLINRICEMAKEQPDKLAVAFRSERLTYSELFERICGVAAILHERGIRRGEGVCFVALSKPETVAVYLGIQYIGAVAVPVDRNATPGNVAALCQDADAAMLLTDKHPEAHTPGCNVISLKGIYEEAGGDVSGREACEISYEMPEKETLAEILFTTGTTGKPKGVMLSYRSVYHILTNTIKGLGIRRTDTVLIPLPLHHSLGLRQLRAVLYSGATAVLQNGLAFAKELENNMRMYHCSGMVAAPVSFETLKGQLQSSFSSILGELRYIEFGSGALTLRQRKEIVALLPDTRIVNTWGSTETGGVIFCNVSEAVREPTCASSLGQVIEGARISIVDEQGKKIDGSLENPGRMCIEGDMNMLGYWKMPILTAETMQEGRFLTSDIAYIGESGKVFMLGRADNIINVGGEKVSPVEVENIASECEGIRECACVGKDDPDGLLGQVPVLYLVPQDDYDEAQLRKYLTARLERYKLPHEYVVMDELPRNRMQKVDYGELKKYTL